MRCALACGLLLGLALALEACGGCSAPEKRQTPREQFSIFPPDPRPREVPPQAPAAGACPVGYPVPCPDGCCPQGTSCQPGGGCLAAALGAACPPDAPVQCDTSVTCPGCATFDASTQGNHAALSSPASFVAGRFGTGVSTNQQSCDSWGGQRISAPTAGFPVGSAPLTLEIWVRTTKSAEQGILAYGAGGLQVAANCRVGTPEHPVPSNCTYHAYWKGCLASAVSINDGRWHFLAGTLRATPLWTVALFVDGTLAKECSLGGGPYFQPGTPLVIGDREAGACAPFDGQIDEVRVLDFAASTDQIARDFANGPMEPIPGTVGLWHFDEGFVGRCCPAGSTCAADGRCQGTEGPGAPALPACPAGSPLCGGGCCPEGSVCEGGGTCVGPIGPPRGGPAGPSCGPDLYCEPGQTCGAPGTCCDDGSSACGEICCAGVGSCGIDMGSATQECLCPAGEVACGDLCCGPGAACAGGACVVGCPDPAFPAACGESCCAQGIACVDGACRCPQSHPVTCEAVCCLVGAPCGADGCGCPPDRAQCGEQCCGEDQECLGGACQDKGAPKPPAGGGGGGDVPEGGACASDGECAGNAICVSSRNCTVSVFSGTCDCAGSTAGQCADFVAHGINVTRCGDCGADFSACCPGSTCVQGTCKPGCP